MSTSTNQPRYRPPHSRVSPRFTGLRTFMRLPHVTELSGVDAAIVGVPFDTTTTFRPGARFGPAAIRDVSVTLRPYHPVHGIDIFDYVSTIDYGDLPTVPGNVEKTYELVAEGLAPLIEAGVLPLVLGGDHSITLAELRPLAARHGPLALVQLDAHVDTWDIYFGVERYTHGTMFRRAVEEGIILSERSVQAGIRGPLYDPGDVQAAEDLGYHVITADDLRALEPTAFGDLVRERVGDAPVFLTFDVDFLDPVYAPGTGGPEVGGFTSGEAQALLRSLAGIRLVGCDCVEVSPTYDTPGQVTALVAANVVWEMMALAAVAVVASMSASLAT
jgi:agmatinase